MTGFLHIINQPRRQRDASMTSNAPVLEQVDDLIAGRRFDAADQLLCDFNRDADNRCLRSL
ncbi:MAG: hypothetical protein QGH93_09735, partial [Gammaproteobacteria bacterium]|nr:hypothetical protein [Gammaproteobacteria bacterium]